MIINKRYYWGQKALAGATPGGKKMVKVSVKWKPLSQSSLDYLSTAFSMSILSILAGKGKEKEEIQRHLNIIKDRFLPQCAKLKVPPGKFGDVGRFRHLHLTEKQKTTAGETSLHSLEVRERRRASDDMLEKNDVEIENFDEKIQILSNQLEESETESQELLQRSEKDVLHLPRPPDSSFTGSTQQEESLKITDPQAALQNVLAIQSSKEMQNILAFLEQAHSQADDLWP
ncbi:centromere protein Q [Acipenser oxyrinchus oxyrinchus]|uniref:Centromere protein Q n=1 Tax=Acipenser oxyrinchus oxyrinchus TaxID=40147 RepID=A0AAD8DCK5_ACIOX|nr:centromere protein Q [Acipenser oxyrinchus oxyrinchus]